MDASEGDTIEVGIERLLCRTVTDTTAQLLKLVLLAAVFSPESNGQVVSTMANLGPDVARHIQQCIEDVVDLPASPSSPLQALKSASMASSPQMNSHDIELLIESRLVKANAQNQAIIEQNRKLTAELDASRLQVASLTEELTRKPNAIPRNGNIKIEELREEHAQVVSALEEELYNYKAEVSIQAKQIAALNSANTAREKIEKERDQLRREVDDLQRESNASENLKKKVKSLQDAQQSVDTLRTDYELALQELNDLRPLREQFPIVQRRLEALTQHISDMEDETSDNRLARERAENELSFLNQSLQDSATALPKSHGTTTSSTFSSSSSCPATFSDTPRIRSSLQATRHTIREVDDCCCCCCCVMWSGCLNTSQANCSTKLSKYSSRKN